MAHGMIIGAEKKFAWNVDAHVGPGCPNKPEDVQVVQYGYYSMGKNPKPPAGLTPAELQVIRSVQPGAPYSGGAQDPLTLAIRAHQRVRGGTQDGKVSPIGNSTGSYGEQTWIMISLCVNMMMAFPEAYPLMNKAPACPPQFAAAIKRTFGHNVK